MLLGSGSLVVLWAFWDPDNGKYEKDVAFSNWSATHHVNCRWVTLLQFEEVDCSPGCSACNPCAILSSCAAAGKFMSRSQNKRWFV